jgi:hypothetical protein
MEDNITRNSFPCKKIEINSWNAIPTIPWKRNKRPQQNISIIEPEKTTFDVRTNNFVNLFCCCFVKLIFSAEFHSVPFRSELRNWLFRGTLMSRNEHGNRSESIPRNFFGTKFRSQPYKALVFSVGCWEVHSARFCQQVVACTQIHIFTSVQSRK